MVLGAGSGRRRSVASVVGVMLATMLIIVSWGMIDTVQVLLDKQFVQIQRYDAQLHISGRPAADVAADVAAVDGVVGVEQALVVPASVVGPAGSILLYTTDVLHRGSAMTGEHRSRFSLLADYSVRGNPWMGKMSWPGRKGASAKPWLPSR